MISIDTGSLGTMLPQRMGTPHRALFSGEAELPILFRPGGPTTPAVGRFTGFPVDAGPGH